MIDEPDQPPVPAKVSTRRVRNIVWWPFAIILAFWGFSLFSDILAIFHRGDCGVDETRSVLSLTLKAIDRYYDEKKEHPATLRSLENVPACMALLSNLKDTDLSSEPSKVYGKTIRYSKDGGPAHRPRLQAPGPDGTFDTSDDIFCP